MNTLPVSEVFGPTIQGEGPVAGRQASFVRFMGCNLSCSWCDSAWTWDDGLFDLAAETTHMSAHDIVDALPERTGIVVLTGGEPLMQQRKPAWFELLDLLTMGGYRIHIETNGTLAPSDYTFESATLIVVSPKLGNAGPHRRNQKPALHDNYRTSTSAVHLKVVCATAADVQQATALASEYGFPPDRTWVMPQGATQQALNVTWPVVATEAARVGVNATHRLHVLAWDDERGR